MSQAAMVIWVWVRSRRRGRCKRHNLLLVSLALQLTGFIWFPSPINLTRWCTYCLASTVGLRTSAHFFHFELIEVSLVLFCHLPFRSLVSVCLGHSLVVYVHSTSQVYRASTARQCATRRFLIACVKFKHVTNTMTDCFIRLWQEVKKRSNAK
jgi:hypothetical protein